MRLKIAETEFCEMSENSRFSPERLDKLDVSESSIVSCSFDRRTALYCRIMRVYNENTEKK